MDHSLGKEAGCYNIRIFKQSYGELEWQGNVASCQEPTTCQLHGKATLEGDHLAQSDLQMIAGISLITHERLQARTADEASSKSIKHRDEEIINAYYFKSLSFGINCYVQ